MSLAHHFAIPLQDNILIFCILLLIILFTPLLFRRLRIPGIVGIILAGVIIGPNGTGLIDSSSSIDLLGSIGLLYIMFLVGLEIDLPDFKKNRHQSIVFGALTFFIPLGLGLLTSHYILHLEWLPAILLSSMFSTHTLLSYPIVSKLGITKTRAVNITAGGTIITDTAVLLVLAIINSATKGQLSFLFWVEMTASLLVFATLVLWGLPFVTRWFFRNLKDEGGSLYVFVLASVFLAGFLSQLAGIEPIIGAFLAGLAFNRLVPHTSPLMNRIGFIGNTLFIPFFLIKVGMIVNLQILFGGWYALKIAIILTVVALFTKYLAAWILQKIYRFSIIERNLIFGLSSSHAAATIAVILVGYNLGLFDLNILNGTILLILITCLTSSFVTERAGRQLAISESLSVKPKAEVSERIMIPIANPETAHSMLDFALALKKPGSAEPVFTLMVVLDDHDIDQKLEQNRKLFEKLSHQAAATETRLIPLSRIDVNVSSGITMALKEHSATELVLGWNGRLTASKFIFGTVLDNLLRNNSQMMWVTRINTPISLIRNIVVTVPENAEVENGFVRWVVSLNLLSRRNNSRLIFFGNPATISAIGNELNHIIPHSEATFIPVDNPGNFLFPPVEIMKDHLFVFVSARKQTLSYHIYLDDIPRYLARNRNDIDFAILYPEQRIGILSDSSNQLDGLDKSLIQENLEIISKLGKKARGALKGEKRQKV
jgi:Kef-type K+ transport system membrane component KefB